MQLRRLILLSILLIAVALLTAASLNSVESQTAAQPPSPKIKLQEAQCNRGKAEAARKGSGGDPKQTNKEKTINIKTDLVVIDVQIMDQRKQPGFDSIKYPIKKEDFTVFEDNVEQEIAHISRDEVPVSLGLVVDTSGRQYDSDTRTVCDSMLDLVKQMRPGDEAFVAQFRDESELVQDFTVDRRKLEDAIGKLYAIGDNSLIDAIIASSDYAKEKAKNRRKALIVFSDGQENNSIVKEKEVIEAIKQSEVLVYFVGIIGQNPYAKSSKEDGDLLLCLADSPGGVRSFLRALMKFLPSLLKSRSIFAPNMCSVIIQPTINATELSGQFE